MVAFKNRYLVMEVFLNPNRDHPGDVPVILTRFNIYNAINESILVSFGECGASKFGSLQVKYFNPITNVCIIRVSREDYQKAWAAITLVKDIANYPVVFNLLDLSVYWDRKRKACWIMSSGERNLINFGSFKACRKAALKCEQSKFEQYKLMVGDRLSTDDTNRMQACLEKVKVLEH